MNKIFESIRRLFGVTASKEVEMDEKLARHKDFCDELIKLYEGHS
ncbi:hypothetical protein ACSMFQ_11640 [Ectopseudomonas chengduensis]|uniref:Uncharacterized protein n=1 Tax=Ectopseudomonas guguanensis TaxID=1198456 RepID=A0A1H0S3W8_9GAMM|nr:MULTISPECIES: hypothetical protein [Pseudomonas]MDH1561431.1 hypothetical protein [Pseudomonas chengduensis]SDP35936.1 hypothetical protein SAMN05216213_103405 [Pseudomonas guguanensis]